MLADATVAMTTILMIHASIVMLHGRQVPWLYAVIRFSSIRGLSGIAFAEDALKTVFMF